MRRIPRMTCGSPWSAVKPRPTDAAGSSRAAFRIVSAGDVEACVDYIPPDVHTHSVMPRHNGSDQGCEKGQELWDHAAGRCGSERECASTESDRGRSANTLRKSV